MEIGDYLRVLRRLWWVVVITTALGAAIGYGSSFLQTPEYQSTARLFVTTQSGSSVGDAYQNNLFSQQRAVSYAGLATSEQVAARAVEQLGTPLSAEELRGKISALAVENTVLLDVTATDSDPANAQAYANAVADQLVRLVSELETSRRGGTPAAGAVMVDDANYPVEATGAGLLTRIGLGAVAGFALGVLMLVIATFTDPRVRRRETVEGATGRLVLGTLVHDPARTDDGAFALRDGDIAAERLRELRTNLLFARTEDGRRPHVIAVTSAAAGDGRTSTAIDLAAALVEARQSVVLVDGDFVSPSLLDRVPLTGDQRAHAADRGLSTVLNGDAGLAQVLIEDAGGSGLAFVPAGPVPTSSRQLWVGESARDVLATLGRDYDYVVIDTPPLGECTDGAVIAASGDGALVLARIGRTRTAGLRGVLDALHTAHATFLGAVVTGESGHRRALKRSRRAAGRSAAPSGDTSPPDTSPPVAAEVGHGDSARSESPPADREGGAHRLTTAAPHATADRDPGAR